jgi:apolipoprotein N-acyltransferase
MATFHAFRIQSRRFIVRAANNGISGFIDCYGRAYKILDENGKTAGARGFATEKIMPSNAKTFYTRFGDLFVYLNLCYLNIILIITVISVKKKL